MFDFKESMDRMMDTGGTGLDRKEDKIANMMGFGASSSKQTETSKVSKNGKYKIIKIEVMYDKDFITPKDIKDMIADINGVKSVK